VVCLTSVRSTYPW